jgi:hypothetical protein
MTLPSFHDGYFHGLLIKPDKTIQLFLQSSDARPYLRILKGVKAVAISEIKAGNIIFDLILRSASDVSPSDISELYNIDEKSAEVPELVKSTRGKALQILELNPTYGAAGLFLFEEFELTKPPASEIR